MVCKKEGPADSQRAGPLWAAEATSHLRSHRRPCPGRATWLHEQCPPAPLLQRRVTGGLTAQSGGPVVRGWILGIEVKGERTSNLPRGGAQASRPPDSIYSLKGTVTKGNRANEQCSPPTPVSKSRTLNPQGPS